MTKESNEMAIPKRATIYLYFLTPYFVSVGVLYLWGFWSTFNVNILEYLGITDVIRLTAYPIASAFITVAFGAVLSEATMGNRFPSGGGRNTRTGIFLRRTAPILVGIYALGILTLLFLDVPNKWYVLPLLLVLPVSFIAKERGFLIEVIPKDSVRSLGIFFLAILPPLAYGHGRIAAADIREARRFDYVLSPIDQVSVASDASPIQRVRFLGHTGDFYFYLNPTNSAIVITKFKDDRTLLLKHFDNAAEPASKR
jgi:hypothetical protein